MYYYEKKTMNRIKSASSARSKTDRSATAPKSQQNKQITSAKLSSKRRSEQQSNSKTRQDVNHKSSNTIVVCDRGTQCNRYTEGVNKLDPIESAQLLGVLKDLRGLKKDDTSSKVINHVEQLLYAAFSFDVGKTYSRCKQSTEAVLLQSKLQKLTAQLEATSTKQMETNAMFQKEKEILTSKLQEQKLLVQTRENEIGRLMQRLQDEKKEADKIMKSQEKTIYQLNKKLTEEMQNKLIAEQYVKYEKEKNQVLSQYKDKLLDDLRLTLKELQNTAVEQFAHLRESDEDHDQIMTVNKKFTCLFSSGSSSGDSSPFDTILWKDETETNISELSRNRLGAQLNEHEKRFNSRDKETNRILNDQDLLSLPDDDQAGSENNF